jgi:hypothetical protein
MSPAPSRRGGGWRATPRLALATVEGEPVDEAGTGRGRQKFREQAAKAALRKRRRLDRRVQGRLQCGIVLSQDRPSEGPEQDCPRFVPSPHGDPGCTAGQADRMRQFGLGENLDGARRPQGRRRASPPQASRHDQPQPVGPWLDGAQGPEQAWRKVRDGVGRQQQYDRLGPGFRKRSTGQTGVEADRPRPCLEACRQHDGPLARRAAVALAQEKPQPFPAFREVEAASHDREA